MMGLLLTRNTNGSIENAHPDDESVVHLMTDDIHNTRERAEFWQEVVCKNFVDVEFTSKVALDFSGELLSKQVGKLRLSAVNAGAHAVRSKLRNSAEIQENSIYATLMLAGGGLIEQDGREVFLLPGDLTFYDATRPHQLAFDQPVKMLLIHLPRDRLREQVAGLEHCTTRRIDGSIGVGAVAKAFLHALSLHMREVKVSNQTELSECAFDLLAAALSSVRPDGALLSRSRALSLFRIKEFVEQHLADPTLNTAMISRDVGLSPRYINKLFDDNDSSCSLSRHIWARRLEYCRQDLSNPAHLGHRISDIALRWGFNDLSHFSRAFKERFNMSPREFRDQFLGKKR